MNRPAELTDACLKEEAVTRRVVTVILVLIAGLSFTFSFGNIWALGRRLAVPTWIAPLVGPAADLSVVGLLVGIRYLIMRGVRPRQLRPARGLLVFSGAATLGLNISGPISQSAYGRAAFDAVGPLLLIGWSEVGPGLMHLIHEVRPEAAPERAAVARPEITQPNVANRCDASDGPPAANGNEPSSTSAEADSGLLDRAWAIDQDHRIRTGRPVSAESLRRELGISTARARDLVVRVRGAQVSLLDGRGPPWR
ncbi:hypothetical protein [Actinomadura rupiterrae]|uniref:hypothetical protein n=1 Tax=Actinomadura rupiterrae TaxID=559627 RepID=UPI0020A4DAED|nr:hypothetical protein [Actinomadura rupiterrae]MCP2338917.1 hypothetical protein [Actinomadura rupiterrae]